MRRTTQSVAWVVAVAVAIAVGLTAVDLVGASVSGRGPLGGEVDRNADKEGADVRIDPSTSTERRTFDGGWGSFVVACRGVYALGEKATPNRAAGWQVFSYEKGPDDDVDAIFTDGRRSIELEVFCNGGSPTIAETEHTRLIPDHSDVPDGPGEVDD
jgi:hypothetical protein